MTMYIQGANYKADGLADCHFTIEVECKESLLPHHVAGLSFTSTCYGSRIPTRHMVKFNGKWRRVYCRIFSNSGTLYIGKLNVIGDRLYVRDYK